MKGFLLHRSNLYSIYYLILFSKRTLVYRTAHNPMTTVLSIKHRPTHSSTGIKSLRVNFKDCFSILTTFFNIIKVIKQFQATFGQINWY